MSRYDDDDWDDDDIDDIVDRAIRRYDRNSAGYSADVQTRTIYLPPLGTSVTQYLPAGQYIPVPDIANIRVPMTPTAVNLNGCVIQSYDSGFFVESRMPVINASSQPLTLQYRAAQVEYGAVGLMYQVVLTGAGQDIGWDFLGPWQAMVVDPATSQIQSLRLFNGPFGGSNLNLGTAGHVATISGIARF